MLRSGQGGLTPPTVSLTVKYPSFFDGFPKKIIDFEFAGEDIYLVLPNQTRKRSSCLISEHPIKKLSPKIYIASSQYFNNMK